jgi:hypothetical protein
MDRDMLHLVTTGLTILLEALQQRIEGLQTTYWTSIAIGRKKVVNK